MFAKEWHGSLLYNTAFAAGYDFTERILFCAIVMLIAVAPLRRICLARGHLDEVEVIGDSCGVDLLASTIRKQAIQQLIVALVAGGWLCQPGRQMTGL